MPPPHTCLLHLPTVPTEKLRSANLLFRSRGSHDDRLALCSPLRSRPHGLCHTFSTPAPHTPCRNQHGDGRDLGLSVPLAFSYSYCYRCSFWANAFYLFIFSSTWARFNIPPSGCIFPGPFRFYCRLVSNAKTGTRPNTHQVSHPICRAEQGGAPGSLIPSQTNNWV